MWVFVEGGKPENPEENPRSKDENQQQTQPTYDVKSGNRTRATLVGGKCSHHCAIPAPHMVRLVHPPLPHPLPNLSQFSTPSFDWKAFFGLQKMKKDLKALKKHKETEIKRISKELKSREEELETTKHTLQLKEAALEGVRAIAQEQTAKIKALEEQLEEMKSALSEVQKNEDCNTWLVADILYVVLFLYIIIIIV